MKTPANPANPAAPVAAASVDAADKSAPNVPNDVSNDAADFDARRKLAKKVAKALAAKYPAPSCALRYLTPFQLLVATILSAQCTDKRVNATTPALFERFPSPRAFADATVEEVGEAIKSCGFYRTKAEHIVAASRTLVEKHGGEVPRDFDALVELPGVGRKTANCVMGNAFGVASGFVVDTHVLRLSRKIGLSDAKTPEKVAADLERLFPKKDWIDESHRLILLGRESCVARRPQCAGCVLESICLKRP